MSIEQKSQFNKLILELFSKMYSPEDYQKMRESFASSAITEKWTEDKYKENIGNFKPLLDLEETNKRLLFFVESFSQNGNYFTTYAELIEVIEISDTIKIFAKDLPLHARIGFNNLLGRNMTEEYYLLEDAIYYLSLGKHALAEFNSLAIGLKKESYNDLKFGQLFQTQKVNIISYCRTSVNLFFRFFNTFINSVAQNYLILNNTGLTDEQIKILNNVSDPIIDSYKSIVEIINPDHKLSEFAEIIETFSKIEESVYNTIFRYNEKFKHTILLNDEGWMKNLIGVYNLIKGLSMIFWQECYPNSGMPEYLNLLDFDRIEQSMSFRMPKAQSKRFTYVKQSYSKDKKKKKRKRV